MAKHKDVKSRVPDLPKRIRKYGGIIFSIYLIIAIGIWRGWWSWDKPEPQLAKTTPVLKPQCGGEGYHHVAYMPRVEVVVPPGQCWTFWILRPSQAKTKFWAAPHTNLDIEVSFEDGTTAEFRNQSPLERKRIKKTITGVRFRSHQTGHAIATITMY